MEIRKALRRVPKVTLDTGDGMTEQAHKSDCDMNVILRDYARTGFIRHAKENEGRYDDFTVQDFQTAMQRVAAVNSLFEGLPASARKEFGNNPSSFLAFAQDPNNLGKMQEMGILAGNDGLRANGTSSGAPVAPSEPAKGETPPV